MNDTDLSTARASSLRLADLLLREHSALADFLVALSEFDRAGGYRSLGFANVFDYLMRELGLSRGAAHYRKVAARLVARFPEVVEPLRDGRLCLSSILALAKVITEANRHEVLPLFFHRSREEANAIAAEIAPAEAVPSRTVVTVLLNPAPVNSGTSPIHPVNFLAAAGEAPRTLVEPLTATRSRIHLTVSRDLLAKLRKARNGQSHVQPDATDEQVIDAALDLLLAQQERRKASVPAKVKREVLQRDGAKCQWPTHDGGICGATVRLEIDHVQPRALGGPSTVDNCRILCKPHNLEAARNTYGDEVMDLFAPLALEAVASCGAYLLPVPARDRLGEQPEQRSRTPRVAGEPSQPPSAEARRGPDRWVRVHHRAPRLLDGPLEGLQRPVERTPLPARENTQHHPPDLRLRLVVIAPVARKVHRPYGAERPQVGQGHGEEPGGDPEPLAGLGGRERPLREEEHRPDPPQLPLEAPELDEVPHRVGGPLLGAPERRRGHWKRRGGVSGRAHGRPPRMSPASAQTAKPTEAKALKSKKAFPIRSGRSWPRGATYTCSARSTAASSPVPTNQAGP